MNWLNGLLALSASAAAFFLLRRHAVLRWFFASIPWWMLASESGYSEFIAAMLTLGGLIRLAVGPTLPGRERRRNAPPLPHLSGGPLAPVTPLKFQTARTSRFITIATIVCFCLAAALGISAAAGVEPDLTIGLALASTIIAVTFAFSNWFSGRLRLRIDERGLHSRVFFAEQTIPWNQIAGLALRYVFIPGMGVRIVYYCAYSSTHEFAFPSSMKGARDLQAAIEAATGLSWAEPEITPTM